MKIIQTSVIKKFLDSIRECVEEINWVGNESVDEHSVNTFGNFTSYTGYYRHFKIVITHHDYKNTSKGKPGSRVRNRRMLTPNAVEWIEITLIDNLGRFGRKELLQKHTIEPEEELYVEVQQLFTDISGFGVIFSPSQACRLGVQEAILQASKIFSETVYVTRLG